MKKIKPWDAVSIPKDRPVYICERTPSFGNKWDKGLCNLVVAITAAGIKMVQCDGSIKSVHYDDLCENWMQVDGKPCGIQELIKNDIKCPKNKICIKQPGDSLINFDEIPESKICRKCDFKSSKRKDKE